MERFKHFFNKSFWKDVFHFYLLLSITHVGHFIFRLLNDYYSLIDFSSVIEFYTYDDVIYFTWFSAFLILGFGIVIILVFLLYFLIGVFSMFVSSWNKLLIKFK